MPIGWSVRSVQAFRLGEATPNLNLVEGIWPLEHGRVEWVWAALMGEDYPTKCWPLVTKEPGKSYSTKTEAWRKQNVVSCALYDVGRKCLLANFGGIYTTTS